MSQPMNREQRRMLKKQGQEVDADGQVVATKSRTKTASGGSGSGSRVTTSDAGGGDDGKRKRQAAAEPVERTSPMQFMREVRSELRKVSWPTRAEVINYSIVVLVTVIVLTIMIGLLDWAFSSSILELFRPPSS